MKASDYWQHLQSPYWEQNDFQQKCLFATFANVNSYSEPDIRLIIQQMYIHCCISTYQVENTEYNISGTDIRIINKLEKILFARSLPNFFRDIRFVSQQLRQQLNVTKSLTKVFPFKNHKQNMKAWFEVYDQWIYTWNPKFVSLIWMHSLRAFLWCEYCETLPSPYDFGVTTNKAWVICMLTTQGKWTRNFFFFWKNTSRSGNISSQKKIPLKLLCGYAYVPCFAELPCQS